MRFILVLFFLGWPSIASTKLLYRTAEDLENRLDYDRALSTYRLVLGHHSPVWKRRAAYRIATLIRNIHFGAGRSERVRPKVVATYKTLLADLGLRQTDPELWDALIQEMRWTRLGLMAPSYSF